MSGHTYTCGPSAPCRGLNVWGASISQFDRHCWHESTARRMAWVYGDDAQALDAATDRMMADARRWNSRSQRSAA